MKRFKGQPGRFWIRYRATGRRHGCPRLRPAVLIDVRGDYTLFDPVDDVGPQGHLGGRSPNGAVALAPPAPTQPAVVSVIFSAFFTSLRMPNPVTISITP